MPTKLGKLIDILNRLNGIYGPDTPVLIGIPDASFDDDRQLLWVDYILGEPDPDHKKVRVILHAEDPDRYSPHPCSPAPSGGRLSTTARRGDNMIEVFSQTSDDFLNADGDSWQYELMCEDPSCLMARHPDTGEPWIIEEDRPATEDEDQAWHTARRARADELKGWYWWVCQPGCLPDSNAHGPFETYEAAWQDAQGLDE